MLSYRFQEQMQEQAAQPSAGFVLLPIAVQGADVMQWVYQKAFEEAQRSVIAERRQRMFQASLN